VKEFPLFDKLETILDSFEVDVDRNWKTAVKFMGSNLHGSKQAALKNLDGFKLLSKERNRKCVGPNCCCYKLEQKEE
jgi:hypothetical protein